MRNNNLKNAIAGEKLKHYKVNNPNLLARYVVMMSKIRSSASIGIIDLIVISRYSVSNKGEISQIQM